MTSLIACLSTGKGTWGHVARLIRDHQWDNVFLITNEFGQQKFNDTEKAQMIVVDANQPLKQLVETIKKELDGKIRDCDVALNLVSGSGKEHMAILSAVLKLGIGIRLVALTKDGMQEI